MSFSDDLKAEIAAEPDWAEVKFKLNKRDYVLRVTALPGWDWQKVKDRHLPRVDVPSDVIVGYDVAGAARDVIPRCSTVSCDGEPVELLVDPEENVDEWADLLKAVGGSTVQQMVNAVFGLNEADSPLLESAKKAQRDAAKTLS